MPPTFRKPSGARSRRWFLLVIVTMTLAAAAWRLARDSVSAAGFIPYVEQAFEGAAPGLDVEIGDLQLSWAGMRRGLDLVATDVHLTAGDAELRIPEVLLKLSLRALLGGHIAPSVLEITGVDGKLVRERDGTIRLVALDVDREQNLNEGFLERVLGELGSDPTPGRPLSYMRNLHIHDATVLFEDRSLGVNWDATDVDVHLYSAIDVAVAGEFRAAAQLAENRTDVDGTLAYDAATHTFTVRTNFAGIPAEAIGNRVPAIRDVARVRTAIHGSVSVDISLSGKPGDMNAEIACSPGTLLIPGWLDTPVAFRDITLHASLDASEQTWQVEPLRVQLGDEATPTSTLTLTAEGTLEDEASEASARLMVENLSVRELVALWPEGVDQDTRKWIAENIDRGRVTELEASARLRLGARQDNARIGVDGLEATFAYEGLRVKWSDKAPPVAGISGNATFRDTALRFAIDKGHVDDVRVVDTAVNLVDLGKKPSRIEIDIQGNGPLEQLLQAIDLRPPDFIGAPSSDRSLGDAFSSFHGRIDFPLVKHIGYEKLRLDVDADLRDVPIHDSLATGTTTGALHFVAVNGDARIDADVDLHGLRSALSVLGWERAPADPGRARFTLTMHLQHPLELRSIDVESEGLVARGGAVFDTTTGTLARLELTELRSGRTDLRHARLDWSPSELRVDLADGDVDLVPVFDDPASFSPDGAGRTLSVTADRLRRMWLAEEGKLENVTGDLRRARPGWERLHLEATLPRTGDADSQPPRLHVALDSAETAQLDATVTAADFGGLLRALGWSAAVDGGSFRLTANDIEPSLDSGRARIEARDFSVADTPLAVRLLSLASFTSILTALQGGDLVFDDLNGELQLDAAQLSVNELRASGSSLGWVVGGNVDLERRDVSLSGTLVPAYTANRFLQSLPVLREVIVGEGILAVDFKIVGPLDDPEATVYPLSAITPELLRGVFGSRRRDAATGP